MPPCPPSPLPTPVYIYLHRNRTPVHANMFHYELRFISYSHSHIFYNTKNSHTVKDISVVTISAAFYSVERKQLILQLNETIPTEVKEFWGRVIQRHNHRQAACRGVRPRAEWRIDQFHSVCQTHAARAQTDRLVPQFRDCKYANLARVCWTNHSNGSYFGDQFTTSGCEEEREKVRLIKNWMRMFSKYGK